MNEKLYSRREFLGKGLGLAAAGLTVPTFLSRTVFAREALPAGETLGGLVGTPHERVLVVIQLSGGNDGLNTVVPFRNDHYFRLRPTLAIPREEALDVNGEIGLHPGLTGFKELYDDAKLAIVQGVGYPNPNRSHFRSMEIWQTAMAEERMSTGWLGRLFDHTCGNRSSAGGTPTLGLNVGNTLNPALDGQGNHAVAIQDPERFYRMTRLFAKETLSGPGDAGDPGHGAQLDFLRRTAMNAEVSAEKIRASVRRVQVHANYPANPLARELKTVAGMIAGGLDARVYYVSLTGFDTHANQAETQKRLLSILGDSVLAFQRDLAGLGQQDRVLGMIFSEFGRRVAENGSRGTDHGKAAPVFLFGQPVRPGVHGRHPSLEALAEGDLEFSVDFRSIYATVLEDWLGTDSRAVLGKRFNKVAVL